MDRRGATRGSTLAWSEPFNFGVLQCGLYSAARTFLACGDPNCLHNIVRFIPIVAHGYVYRA